MIFSRHPAARSLRVRRASAESAAEEAVAREVPLEIRINGETFSMTMCSPGQEELLARGLLFAEGVVPDPFWYPCERPPGSGQGLDARIIDMLVPERCVHMPETPRRLAATASCGLCGRGDLTGLDQGLDVHIQAPPLPASEVPGWFTTMSSHQGAFGRTGGTHAAAAFSPRGQVLCVHEDIGRHNAVDKVIGGLIADARLDDAAVLAVSGRVSFEIMAKALRAGFSCVAAVSAPSSLAVDLARRSGMTLLAFCRDDRFTVYHGGETITDQEGLDVRFVI